MMSTNSAEHPMEVAIAKLGLPELARICQVSYMAIRKWQMRGRMPRTEYTGETCYADTIIAQVPELTKAQLLAPWPAWQPNKRRSKVVAISSSDSAAQSC